MQRRALTIGINNYPGNELSGCVNDANDWAELWRNKGFDDVTIMLDSDATYLNIIDELNRHVSSLKYRDTLVVCYSGHGSWVPDTDGDEVDGRDEVWVAQDFRDGGLILDDTLYDIFSQKKFGSRIIVLSDSCFSGTVSRFFEGGHIVTSTNTQSRPRVRFLPPGHFLEGQQLEQARKAQSLPKSSKSRSTGALISGCDEDEYSYDAWFGSGNVWRANGAFTYNAIKTLSGDLTVKQWYDSIREWLPSEDYPQSPQLQASWTQKRWKVA